MEVAIGNEITETIIAIRKDKVQHFELLELMNKFESACILLCPNQISSQNLEKQKM